MAGPPPPRYRVVEEGRRLVVIDLWADGGRPTAGTVIPAPQSSSWFERTRFDGGGELHTHSFYDVNGPRTIRLDPGSARILKIALAAIAASVLVLLLLAPWLLIPLVALVAHRRALLRERLTGWLDLVASEAG